MKKSRIGLLASSILLAPVLAIGAEVSPAEAQVPPEGQGLTLGLMYRADVFSNVSGGLKQKTTALGNLDATLDFDLDKLAGWEGVSIGLHGIASHGGKPNAQHVGSSQGVDNIEVDTNTARILQAWIQKQWQDDRYSVLLGLYDLNAEFYVSNSSGLFLHPAAGIGSEFAQAGQNGPSIFPTTSIALRAVYRPTAETYLQAAVLDGVPGDPDNPRGTHIQFNKSDGTLRVVELGYVPGVTESGQLNGHSPTDKYAVGAWSYTARFADLVDVDGAGDPLMRKGNSGFYALAEKTLYRGTGNPDSSTDGFIRFGRASADFNQFSSYFQIGLVFSGMVPGRSDDQFGVSYIQSRTGEKYRLATINAGQTVTQSESVWEATYRAQVSDWLAIQPNIQYVINPGTDAQIRNATVLGVRFEMVLEK